MAQVREGKFATLKTKILWTALFFVCFMAGRSIPIPLLREVTTGTGQASTEVLNAANIASGGNFFRPSVFSLGLGPWMGAAILWRFLFIGKIARDRKIPEETVKRARNLLMVVLAVVQAISLMSRYEVRETSWWPFSERLSTEVVVVIVLTAGAVLVAWLANQNEDKGLGGVTMFILYQIIITAMQNRSVLSAATADDRSLRVLWLVILACVCVVIVGAFVGNAETRLHVNKVSIDNGYTGVSYLPIKRNPAGASPIMYALTLLAIPQYVAHAVSALVPGTSGSTDRFLGTWGLSTPLGFTSYLLLLFGMTIFFGLFTVSPRDIARRMRNNGEYFDNIAPGQATRRFLRRRVVGLSAWSGAVLVLLTGLPLFFIRQLPDLQYVLMAPGTVMILVGILWTLREEISDTMLGKRYSFTFKTGSDRVTA